MRKFLFHFAIAVKVILSVSQLAYSGERPASAPPIDERLTGIESRVDILEGRVDALEGKTALACPCPDGPCICPAGQCKCPNCIDHISNNRVVETYTQNKVEIDKIWEAMAEDEDGTMKKAVQIWLRQQLTGKKSTGRTAIVAGASWCGPCKEGEAERKAAGLVAGKDYEYFDVDSDPTLKAKYSVVNLPALILLENGKVVTHHTGLVGMTRKLGDWIGKPLPAGTGANLVGGKPSVPAASRDIPKISSYLSSPIPGSSLARQYPYTSRSVVRYGGSTWTWPGNLRSHLASAHGINTNGLSDSELRTIHDNLHNTGRSGITGGQAARPVQYARQTYQPRVYYSSRGSYCPTCPR
jgi:thiol-disulfide isomerase/thioredoxin